MDNKLKIATFVPLEFQDSYASIKLGGGWRRFKRIIDNSDETRLTYLLLSFKFFSPPIIQGAFRTLISMARVLLNACNVVKTQKVDAFLCPIEDPWIIILAYLCSKLTGRKLVIFINSIPYFGMTNVHVSSQEAIDLSYRGLLKKMLASKESKKRAPFSALFWGISLRILLSKSTKVVCLSKILSDQLYALSSKHSVGIYPGNGIDFEVIKKIKKTEVKYDAIYATGSLLAQKGVFDAVRIWYLVVAKQPNAKLAIAGRVNSEQADLINDLNDFIDRLNLRNNISLICDLTVGLTPEILWREMKSAKVFLYPSKKDVWPLVVGEALACGLPVVAYDLPGIINAYAGCLAIHLIKIGDIERAAQVITSLLQKELTAEVDNAYKYASNLSWRNVARIEYGAYLSS